MLVYSLPTAAPGLIRKSASFFPIHLRLPRVSWLELTLTFATCHRVRSVGGSCLAQHLLASMYPWLASAGMSWSVIAYCTCSAASISSRGPAARRIGPHTRSTTKGVTATAALPQDGERNIVAAATAESAPPVSVDLDTPLPSHPELVRGRLENGFEYVIIPNRSPPNRFEAHLQVCMPFKSLCLCSSVPFCTTVLRSQGCPDIGCDRGLPQQHAG